MSLAARMAGASAEYRTRNDECRILNKEFRRQKVKKETRAESPETDGRQCRGNKEFRMTKAE
jgi:hypothetical protein